MHQPNSVPISLQVLEAEKEHFKLKSKELNDPSYQPQITNNVPIPKLGKVRDKFNSTATIFMSSNQNFLSPSVGEIVKCLSMCFYWKMKELETQEPKVLIDIFEEGKYPLGMRNNNYSELDDSKCTPPMQKIHHFIKTIYDTENLSAECAVMALIFVERLMVLTNITLQGSNWRRVLLGSIIISSKIWEDTAVWISDFKSVFPRLRLSDLSKLEREYLRYLDFNVAIKSSVYAKYYFALRNLAERNEINFPLLPLTKTKEEELEAKSQGIELKARQSNLQRSQSLESFVLKDPQVGMEDIKLSEIHTSEDKM